jgi:DNA polymerase/3'-5' exonuclease PolX
MADYKPLIVDALTIMMKSDQMKADDPTKRFKVAAYKKVIKQLAAIEGPIRGPEDVADLPGVGAKIKEKFAEIFATGRLEAADRAVATKPIALFDELLKVHGIGAVKARKLVDAGITSIADLRTKVSTNPKLIDAASKIGLAHYDDFQLRIDRSEMEQHDKIIHDRLPPGALATIVGSYRRGAASSGDIDALLVTEGTKAQQVATFKAYIASLQTSGYITDILALGAHKCMAVCRIGEGLFRRLDLLLTPPREFAFALLYFTGSDTFNVAMRSWALETGWSLNEHEFTRVGGSAAGAAAPPPMEDEQDIFNFLGLQYVPPTERKGPEQVKAAPQVKIKIKRSA